MEEEKTGTPIEKDKFEELLRKFWLEFKKESFQSFENFKKQWIENKHD